MEVEPSPYKALNSLCNGSSILKNVLTSSTSQMDCVTSTSDSITINSESSKDDSVASFDDATSARPEENGIDDDSSRKVPVITLAKTVTLKNVESINAPLTIDTPEADNSNDSGDHELVMDLDSERQDNVEDPLTNSIVLSESEGEVDNENANPCFEVISSGSPVFSVGKIRVKVQGSDSTVSANSSDATSTTTLDDVEILSEGINNSPTTSAVRKQIRIFSSNNKKNDNIVLAPVKILPEIKECLQCCKETNCNLMLEFSGVKCYICSEKCMVDNRFAQKASLQRAFNRPTDANRPLVIRKCSHCKGTITPNDNTLSWETMDFCNEDCLKNYQNLLGISCSNCKKQCQEQSLGKYCVRFGFDIRQFCHSSCLEEFKRGIKVCSFCQDDISANQGLLAAMNDRQQIKDFCSEECITNYEKMSSNMPIRLAANTCDVCKKFKLVTVEVMKAGKCYKLCSDVCFNAFKFVNPNPMGFCDMCRKHFDSENSEEQFYTFADEVAITFCSKTCMNAYVLFKRKIVQCNWCKVKKYNFDMIKKIFSNRQVMMLCSFHCFSMWKQSPKRNTCDHCKTFGQIQYHLGMSDGTLRSFCGHECLMTFQLQFKKVPVTPSSARPLDSSATLAYPVVSTPSSNPKITQVSVKIPPQKKTADNSGVLASMSGSTPNFATICAPPSSINDNSATIPVISSVTSLESSINLDKSLNSVNTPTLVSDSHVNLNTPHMTVNPPKLTPRKPVGVLINKSNTGLNMSNQMLVKQQLLLVPPAPVVLCNKSTNFNCYPATKSKGIYCRPNSIAVYTQYSKQDFEGVDDLENEEEDEEESSGENTNKSKSVVIKQVIKEVPVVIPIPVPIYIPVPIPLYNMPMPTPVPIPIPVPICIPTPHQSLDQILDEIMEICKKVPDLVSERRRQGEQDGSYYFQNNEININTTSRLRKRGHDEDDSEVMETSDSNDNSNKRRRLDDSSKDADYSNRQSSNHGDDSSQHDPTGNGSGSGGDDSNDPNQSFSSTLQPASSRKQFQNIYGVNAWKKWVITKNEELSKSGSKLFGTEILWLSSEELCESLALFVHEFCKPNGEPYPADIIYYLVLGIQDYLKKNGKSDDIFSDNVYEKFNIEFDNIITKESNSLQSPDMLVPRELLVPRIEEEHLYESGQLGAGPPFTLLFTMLYFITKGFYITDIEGHYSLAFSQIMRQWPRGQNSSEKQVTKYQSLRYFPPNPSKGDCSKDTESSKKKYEITENISGNIHLDPVDLYNFYLSKCPESVRNRSDMFYLEPEKSYLADSPIWFSTEPLNKSTLNKMFNRLRLVREISLILNPESTS